MCVAKRGTISVTIALSVLSVVLSRAFAQVETPQTGKESSASPLPAATKEGTQEDPFKVSGHSRSHMGERGKIKRLGLCLTPRSGGRLSSCKARSPPLTLPYDLPSGVKSAASDYGSARR